MNRLSLLRLSPALQHFHCVLRFISSHLSSPSVPRRTHNPAESQTSIAVNPNSQSIESNIYSCNLRISCLGRSHEIKEARELFDRMPQRDVVTYSSMINLHLKNGDLPQAESLFRELPEGNIVAESAMINGYAKAGRIDDARMIFDHMPMRNVFSWTSLISGYCQIGQIDEARRLFDRMPVRNVVSWTTMVLGYARNGLLSDARDLFDQMPEKNVVSWTSMIKSYIENGRIDEARDLFDRMPQRNAYSWNTMLSGYLDSKQHEKAIGLFRLMPQKNVVSWTTMCSGLARNGLTDKAREFFDQMPRRDIASWNAMITGYVDGGFVLEARELFDSMPERTTVTWNATIDGYVKNDYHEEASRLFLLMLRSPVKQNETTLTSIVGTCGSTIKVMEIHALATKLGFESDTSFTNALVTMYSRSGDLASSRRAFGELIAKDAVSWTSMILAYSNHGCGDYALQAFAQMLRYGAEPDGVTFVGVLSACSHVGLVKKGKMIFESMSRAYGIEPQAGHYSCLVDLLGRAGHVEEAMMVVTQMPKGERDEAVLGALLGACRVHGKIDVASSIGEEVIELDPLSSGGYVLLANAYASRGKWTDVARVRKMMKERKVKKVPGFSRIETKKRSHVFYVGDRSHPQVKEIYAMLDEELLPQMKDTGDLQCI